MFACVVSWFLSPAHTKSFFFPQETFLDLLNWLKLCNRNNLVHSSLGLVRSIARTDYAVKIGDQTLFLSLLPTDSLSLFSVASRLDVSQQTGREKRKRNPFHTSEKKKREKANEIANQSWENTGDKQAHCGVVLRYVSSRSLSISFYQQYFPFFNPSSIIVTLMLSFFDRDGK